jgi:hypothetical protein
MLFELLNTEYIKIIRLNATKRLFSVLGMRKSRWILAPLNVQVRLELKWDKINFAQLLVLNTQYQISGILFNNV